MNAVIEYACFGENTVPKHKDTLLKETYRKKLAVFLDLSDMYTIKLVNIYIYLFVTLSNIYHSVLTNNVHTHWSTCVPTYCPHVDYHVQYSIPIYFTI